MDTVITISAVASVSMLSILSASEAYIGLWVRFAVCMAEFMNSENGFFCAPCSWER